MEQSLEKLRAAKKALTRVSPRSKKEKKNEDYTLLSGANDDSSPSAKSLDEASCSMSSTTTSQVHSSETSKKDKITPKKPLFSGKTRSFFRRTSTSNKTEEALTIKNLNVELETTSSASSSRKFYEAAVSNFNMLKKSSPSKKLFKEAFPAEKTAEGASPIKRLLTQPLSLPPHTEYIQLSNDETEQEEPIPGPSHSHDCEESINEKPPICEDCGHAVEMAKCLRLEVDYLEDEQIDKLRKDLRDLFALHIVFGTLPEIDIIKPKKPGEEEVIPLDPTKPLSLRDEAICKFLALGVTYKGRYSDRKTTFKLGHGKFTPDIIQTALEVNPNGDLNDIVKYVLESDDSWSFYNRIFDMRKPISHVCPKNKDADKKGDNSQAEESSEKPDSSTSEAMEDVKKKDRNVKKGKVFKK